MMEGEVREQADDDAPSLAGSQQPTQDVRLVSPLPSRVTGIRIKLGKPRWICTWCGCWLHRGGTLKIAEPPFGFFHKRCYEKCRNSSKTASTS